MFAERGAARAARAATRRCATRRRLLAQLRTESTTPAPEPFQPPVGGAGGGFGEPRTYTGIADAESRFDALSGERHRGLDYRVPPETPVRAPAAGSVLFAGTLRLAGGTVVIDHGQGVVSVLHHLASVAVREGDAVAADGRDRPIGPERASRRSRCWSGASISTRSRWTRWCWARCSSSRACAPELAEWLSHGDHDPGKNRAARRSTCAGGWDCSSWRSSFPWVLRS